MKRDGFTLTLVGSKLYAVGGFHWRYRSIPVEVFDASGDWAAWQCVASLQTDRVGLSSATVRNILYVAGGICRQTDSILATVECNDSDHDIWQSVAPTSTARYGLGLAELDGMH